MDGQTDSQIVAWMTARYGDFVRLKPPFNPITALLWASPLVALLVGLGAAWMSRHRVSQPAIPLDPAEQSRLRELLNP